LKQRSALNVGINRCRLTRCGPLEAACSLLGQEAGLGQREALPGDALDSAAVR
jgi:hypothetical protein